MTHLRLARAREFMRDAEFMRSLRYDNDTARRLQRSFGKIWAEYGTDVYQIIADASLDLKKTVAVNQKANDDVDRAREKGSRGWEHEFQGVPEESKRELEEEKGPCGPKRGGSKASPQKDCSPQKEKEEVQRLRRAGFYRDAGGCA